MGITPVGRKTRGLTFEHTARRDTAGTPDLLSVETMTVVGGVIFVETARPAAPEYACPTFPTWTPPPVAASACASRSARRRWRPNLYDWELAPLAAFVDSGSDALFTYMGIHGEYHEAFAGNLAGFNLFLLDTFRSLNKPRDAHRMVKTVVPGYTDGVAEPTAAATRRLTRWMRSSHLMFTDFEVDFAFRPDADRLAIDGEPYWMAVSGMGASARIDRRFEDSETTLAANPAVFGSGFRLAKHAAFFRYLKSDLPRRVAPAQRATKHQPTGVGPVHDSASTHALRGALLTGEPWNSTNSPSTTRPSTTTSAGSTNLATRSSKVPCPQPRSRNCSPSSRRCASSSMPMSTAMRANGA